MANSDLRASIKTALKSAADQLQLKNEEYKLEAEVLLMFVLEKPRSFLHAWPEKKLTEKQSKVFQKAIKRRLEGEPIAYITCEKEFWSLPLKITTDVLIPRPETELLVELALEKLNPDEKSKVADLGTGSGAIALALAHERPNWKITATDSSVKALRIAEENASLLHINNITFITGQWCEALTENDYDLIISNPPYVAENNAYLKQGDLPFEPQQALASGKDGLDDIKNIIQQARIHLKPGGWLMLEHGYDQKKPVTALFNEAGYQAICSFEDMAGLPRSTIAITKTS